MDAEENSLMIGGAKSFSFVYIILMTVNERKKVRLKGNKRLTVVMNRKAEKGLLSVQCCSHYLVFL